MTMGCGSGPTRPQVRAMTLVSLFALAVGVLVAAMFADLGMGKGERGLIMPPGMIMASNNSNAAAMRDMAAVAEHDVSYKAPQGAVGGRVLAPQIDDGVKVFHLTTSVIQWNILPDRTVRAYAVNRQVPGPTLRIAQGDRIRVIVRNDLPDPTSIHWHGLDVPNSMDGAAGITQPPIKPGATFTYRFTVHQAGTFLYHSHYESDRQQGLGLYGAFIVDPKRPDAALAVDQDIPIELQEWTVKQGQTFPAMEMEGALPNFFTINGKAYPATQTVHARVGQKLRFRFIGTNTTAIHPMHIHGGPFRIVATDGNAVPASAQVLKDTVDVGPGERYDVIWTARRPGRWLLHCHIPHHTTNDNVEQHGGGGLTMVIDVSG
jgi:FtsP/CotA-like multicopper oxidase with cupredoxin domain